MAGKKKIGLDFWYHDTNAFQDLKVRKLIKRKGGAAYTVYVCLLCEIYRHGYYIQYDDELPFFICEQTGVDEEYIKEVVKTCLNIGLFDKKLFKKKVLSSQRIQEHFTTVNHQAKRTATIDKYSLISSEDKAISSEDMVISSENNDISSKKSGRNDLNKIKENKIEPPPPKSPSPLTGKGDEEGGLILSIQETGQPSPTIAPGQPQQGQGSPHTYFALINALKGNIGITDAQYEDDIIWECMRLTNDGRTDSVGMPLIREWLAQPDDAKRVNKFSYLVQRLQRAEQDGYIKCRMSHNEYFMFRWLRLNLKMGEYKEVESLCKDYPNKQLLCQDCIKEIKASGGKIKLPGKFILARLKEQ